MDNNKPIYVTQPALPDLQEFIPYLEKIWDNKILTNNGPFHMQLEKALAEFLEVPFVSLFANGTLALIVALRALNITGEVITTPYSFVATSHSLLWNNIKPVFVDIEPNSCNIDSEKIEKAITKRTTAILPVHVYGNPCQTERIQEIANTYKLKVIYDAAHAFGVKQNGKNICTHGDLSALSFHATKVFNTMEGGAIVSHSASTKKKIDYLKNHGFFNETKVKTLGLNSKMNEMQSALGLLQLKNFHQNIQKRKRITQLYQKELEKIKGISFIVNTASTEPNFTYFPIFVNKNEYGMTRDDLFKKLKKNNIFARRYFYPLISNFPMYKSIESARSSNLPEADKIAENVICLPIFSELDLNSVYRIIDIIKNKDA
ncbi:DegT/DnrJ/EryC1/StrS family aminotransferase [Maribellus comscasis]|uniref:DegT/DnrJ/EryC1/StrS family aminotransferase n=1 Tax=Maribellus comscasis TaxID=2681766 RepID=A0A6I6JKA8_9BACT|nr:DegT/DnrJ/EryC1/StrS family aminotransferase [Maribellus comscasis]QGY42741.1 DegT/DnrJ/EryC1/StrS family aminotransferase [Maribellus comscasis]